jgi:hypothetical protein
MTRDYQKTYTSFAGTDIVATVTMPAAYGGNSYVLGELQTISYSIHRDVAPVLRLGRSGPAGFTSGYRTIGGSMIFTVFNQSVVYTLRDLLLGVNDQDAKRTGATIDLEADSPWLVSGSWQTKTSSPLRSGVADVQRRNSLARTAVLMDELPPFDINIVMRNEYGNGSILTISGIVIIDEGQVMSIEDLLTENTYSYMAMDISPLQPLGD